MRSLFVVATLLLAAAGAVAQTPAAHPPVLPAGPGQAQVQTACAGCHDMSVVTGQHHSPAEWDEIVQQMVSRGAPVNEADYDTVVAYLAKNYGEKK